MAGITNDSNGFFLNNQLVVHENRSKSSLNFDFCSKKWAYLERYPNLPNFLINDVIPDVLFLFRSRNPIFWIQRSFLHQNRSNCIRGQMISSCFKSIYLISMSLKITLFCHLCPSWRHRFLRMSKMLISAVFSNIHNFAKNQYLFTRIFLFVS